MIKINSELPVDLLNRNLMLNDFDFVLFHLFESNDKYRRYFYNLRATKPERTMILDNSAYELYIHGCELNLDDYVSCIRFLDPDFYILPDTLMDMEKTLKSVDKFLSEYNNTLNCFSGWSVPIAVLQGNTPEELIDCYKVYSDMGLSHIAIPFHNSFFKDMGEDKSIAFHHVIVNRFANKYNIGPDEITDDMWYAIGRIKFIHEYSLILKNAEYIHLLGSHCPFEKCFYSLDNIKSMDTGYPVKCAIEGHKLFEEPSKPNIIIDDFVNTNIYASTRELIMNNVWKFKTL